MVLYTCKQGTKQKGTIMTVREFANVYNGAVRIISGTSAEPVSMDCLNQPIDGEYNCGGFADWNIFNIKIDGDVLILYIK